MGDISYTLVFPLAKTLRKNPKQIAQEIIQELQKHPVPEIARIEIGGNGYINFFLNRDLIARELMTSRMVPEPLKGGKAIVEHTNINPNKAAHVGHLRNACLGDTLVRLLEFMGTQVEVQNYIDDTGVQLADVVHGFQRLGKEAKDLATIPGKIDYYFWDLYAETHKFLEESPDHKIQRDQILKAMEQRTEPVFSLSQQIADLIIRSHLRTMSRLGIDYELLPRESDILGLHFWEKTFAMLKEKGVVTRIEEGKNKGCWVMRLSGSEEFEDMQNPDKILVRSNGIVTYAGKDIAYQLWKFGLLGEDFYYRIFDRKTDHVIWTTSSVPGEPDHPNFGGAQIVYNVIDQRQSYLQKVVAEGLRALGYPKQAANSIHFSYEMVTLSPKSARELGFELSAEEQEKNFVEMSGRRGLGVKADDLLDRLEDKLQGRISPLYPDLEPGQLRTLTTEIAAGALRYFMIRFTRNTIITFDLDEVLSFEGETGPYLQYSIVRARNILRKLDTAGFNVASHSVEEFANALHSLEDFQDQEGNDSWQILLGLIKTKEIITRALRSLELSYFAKHVFEMAQLFNNYYHKYPVLHESDLQRKLLRIAIVRMFINGMQSCLDLMGIPVPSKM
jgi:arginyl-tRNA synthetase